MQLYRSRTKKIKLYSKIDNNYKCSFFQVEKSLQRINRGYKNAMYTSQKSIENKVGDTEGWKDLLMSVGFRFEPAANGIPSAVFFPQVNNHTICPKSLPFYIVTYLMGQDFLDMLYMNSRCPCECS